MKERRRLRELGIQIGVLTPGKWNALTDVPGVLVGHTTLIEGHGPLKPGDGPVRTGVTVVLPHRDNLFQEKVPAAVYTLNGFGKAAGFEQVRELGLLESPLALTNTLNVGLVVDALVQAALRENPAIGVSTGTVNVVVGETNDGYLNDIQGRHVRTEHVFAALTAASHGSVTEGSVGAGTGTTCFGWKGGIGTASRVLPAEAGGFILGALLQTNFGRGRDLIVAGVHVGAALQPPSPSISPASRAASRHGSVMIVLATDAPLDSRQLGRLCRRTGLGLGHTGSLIDHGSGDFALAFSTAWRQPHEPPALTGMRPALLDEARVMSALFRAVVECVEEAVLNSLTASATLDGRDGHVAYGLPLDDLLEILYRKPGRNG